MTLFIVLSSFINFTITPAHFIAITVFIIILQFIFISIFKSVRPTVNL
jgi:hypothetical protein